MLTQSVVKNSLISNGTVWQSISSLFLQGFNTIPEQLNFATGGLLYGSFTLTNGTYTFNLYKDIGRTQLVASGSTTGDLPQTVAITENNDSGLSGYVLMLQYGEDDNQIVVQCLLSDDSDIPLDNLTSLPEYDPLKGFAYYHQLAWNYLVNEFVVSRNSNLLFDPNYQCLRQGSKDPGTTTNSKLQVGGYNLARVLNWDVLREVSAHYLLSRVSEKHQVETNDTWAIRSLDSRQKLAAYLHSVDLAFDNFSQGVETKRRSLNTWKVYR